jgi:hypothetical protein
MSRRPLFQLGLGFLLLFAARVGLAAPCQDRFCGIDDATHTRVKTTAPDQRVREFIRSNNLPTFATTRGVPVFAVPKRLYSSSSGYGQSATYSAGEKQYLTVFSPNLVEFAVSSHHLHTRVGDRDYDNIWSLSDNAWRGPSSYSGDRLGVLVQLSDSEMTRLRQWIDRARQDHEGVLGRFNFNGGDPNTPAPNKASNCTSWVTCARVGDRGETIGQLMGLGNGGEPYSWVKGLARYGGSRVKGVVVHGPDEQKSFNQSYLDGLFEKYTYRP